MDLDVVFVKVRAPAPSVAMGASALGVLFLAIHAVAGDHPPPSVPSETSRRFQYGRPWQCRYRKKSQKYFCSDSFQPVVLAHGSSASISSTLSAAGS
jgi:hypothetical protein